MTQVTARTRKRKLRLTEGGQMMCRCGLVTFPGPAAQVVINGQSHAVFCCESADAKGDANDA